MTHAPTFSRLFRELSLFASVAAFSLIPAFANENKPSPVAGRSGPTHKESINKTGVAVPKLTPGLAGSFLSGRFARQNQDLKEAAKYLAETLSHDPENTALINETMRMHLLAGDMPAATELAHKLAKLDVGNDAVAASLLMLEAIKFDRYAEAKKAIERVPSAGLFGLIRPALGEWLALGAGEHKAPVDLKAAIDKAGFFAPFMNYQAALMNDVAGDATAAQSAYTKANADPTVTPYRVVEALANFYARMGKWEEAQAVYDSYSKANPQSTLIPEKFAAGSPAPKPLVGDVKQGVAELYFTTASILFGEDAAQDTFIYLRIALDLRPNFPPAQLMMANLYEQLQDYKQAIAMYDDIPENSVFYHRAQVRRALNLEAMGQKDKAIAALEQLSKRFPNESTALITKGDMEREAKRYDDAAQSYSSAIERTEPLKPNDWPLLYARGISYERDGNWAQAEKDFERALEIEPDQPDVLNYLAYSWLMMNKNIEKAREYLETAASARPDDPHIVDSIGWAYYLAGNYGKAVDMLEKAIEQMPDDPTVNEHLGDAYFRVGRETEARYQWHRALTFKPEPEVAEAIQKKIDKGLPPVSASQRSSQMNARAAASNAPVRVQ